MSSSKQNQTLKSHSSVPSSADVNINPGTSVKRATGSTHKVPSLSDKTSLDNQNSWFLESSGQKTLISDAMSSSPRKRKIVQHGIIPSYPKIEIIIFFQTVPWWLLALDPESISTIYFPQFQSNNALISFFREQAQGRPFVKILSKFFLTQFSFSRLEDLDTDVMLFLISGNFEFLSQFLASSLIPKNWIFCTEQHQRLRAIPDFPFSLHRAVHHKFGGPTKYELFWASSAKLNFDGNSLFRTIGDYLNYSIRPQPCSQSTLTKFFEPKSLLPIKGIFSDIIYPTHFSATGFGKRPLDSEEMSLVFGIPARFLSFFQLSDFPLPPIQILDALLLGWKNVSLIESRKIRKIEVCVPTPSPVSDSTPIFLNSIKKTLPLSWSFAAPVATKAAKADDATVSESLWNNRIVLIWPHAHLLVGALRTLVLRRQRRLMYLEFQSYLKKRYGVLRTEYFTLLKRIYAFFFGNHMRGDSTLHVTYNDTCKDTSEIKEIRKSLKASKFHQLRCDIECGIKGLHCFSESSFFGWDKGSTLFFWRWHPGLQRIARDGFPSQISASLPNSFRKARPPKSSIYKKILSKLIKSLSRGYLIPSKFSKINNLIDYFAVPKADDIRMVQNGSSCGLNKAIWASNFWLPNANSMTRVLGYNYKAVDLDLGEMFLNFPLDKKLISYSGMDLSPYKKDLLEFLPGSGNNSSSNLYVVNGRNWMGLRPSPEWSCRFYYLAEEFIRGNEKEVENPLRWDRVILNLIGIPDFNPALPNVFKWNEKAQRLAGEIKAYVDDLRALGWSLEHAWQIAHLIACRLQFLGIQDAPRKRRIDQGPWAGSIYITDEKTILQTVTKEKWLKAKRYIYDIKELLSKCPDHDFDFKYLEQVRGFLCHLALTFEIIFPFLKGFHLTLCSHLTHRNYDGWKINDMEWLAYLEEARNKGIMTSSDIDHLLNIKYDPKSRPKSVKALPRFVKSINALHSLFNCDDPPSVTVRTRDVQFIVYGFADASKSGFGASLEYVDGIHYRVGTWSSDEDSASSNFREFANIVETIEDEVSKGKLKNSTLILATDNSTVESALFKGNSTSELLFDLVVRFKTMELHSGSKFIVTHVSGERMKFQGTDGISRGQLREGIALGTSMLHYCPWGLSAIQRHPPLLQWCHDVFGSDLEVLSPCQWFSRGHDHNGGFYDERGLFRLNIKHGTYLWQPPPAAADAALEELRKARLKRRQSTHIIIIPRLCTTLWLKQLYKAADIVFYLPPLYSHWPCSMYEPLVIAILFPYARYFPWQFKNTPRLLSDRRKMQKMFQEAHLDTGSVLRKFFLSTRKISCLSEHLVRKLLYFGQPDDVPYSSSSRVGVKRKKSQ